MMTMMLYGWFDENEVDTMKVSDINCPNENDGTSMTVINDIKEWIRSSWTYFDNVLFIFISMFDLMLILLKNNFKWK